MRKYAFIKEKESEIKKIMVFASTEGISVFLYNTVNNVSCFADTHFEELEAAKEYFDEMGIAEEDWIIINDPIEGYPEDLIY
ncbi:hypothetical protein [Metabacillus sp. cB07]|uniref:hypothetical protein n=1 Tax=Metabacillus sp. cB07 TaxID=2806989 RepID=UPI001939F69E|nr:hypothetical protein [Metabacillus sp. cB07]